VNPIGNAGQSSPLGATVVDGSVNFSVFSRSATSVEVLLFDREDEARPARVLRLDPAANRTYHYWHVCLPGIRPGQLYGYRVDGPAVNSHSNAQLWVLFQFASNLEGAQHGRFWAGAKH
jgi:isoamylase